MNYLPIMISLVALLLITILMSIGKRILSMAILLAMVAYVFKMFMS